MGTSSTSMANCLTELRALWTKRWKSRKRRPRTSAESYPRPNLCRPRPLSSTLTSFASNLIASQPIYSSTSRLKWMSKVTLAQKTTCCCRVATRAPLSTPCTKSMWSSMCAVWAARVSRQRSAEMQARVCSTWSASSVMPREHVRISRKDSTLLEEESVVLPDKSDTHTHKHVLCARNHGQQTLLPLKVSL
mgnify:CR=1 FL=1